MCYDKSKVRKGEELSPDEILGVVRQLNKGLVSRLGSHLPTFILQGGEVFLHKDMWAILDVLDRSNRTILITNGTLLDEAGCRRLVDTERLMTLNVSLDGPPEVHDRIRGVDGTGERVLRTLRTLYEMRVAAGKTTPRLLVTALVQAENFEALPKLAELLVENRADALDLIAVYDLDRIYGVQGRLAVSDIAKLPAFRPRKPILREALAPVLDEVERICASHGLRFNTIPAHAGREVFLEHYAGTLTAKGLYCHAPWEMLRIGPYGDVYPCYDIYAGNIREMDVMDIWNGEVFRSMRRLLLTRKSIPPACLGCCFICDS